MTNTDATSGDSLDARIDKRFLLLQDGLELRLTKTVDTLLKSRFETAVKLLGWAFGLVALVFTLFGIKTTIDLREAAKSTAIDEVKKKLAIDDPNSDFRREVDRVVTRGVINSYFLELARNKDTPFAPDIRVSDVDIRRLMDVVKDARSDDRDFRDALDVLVRTPQMKEGGYLERLVLSLGNASEKTYEWMRDQPEKRATLLELFSGEKLASSARSIASDEKTDKRLLLAATKYLAKVQDKDSLRLFERLSERSDEDVSRAAIQALARVAPESKVVSNALSIKPQASGLTVARTLGLAAVLAESSRRSILEDDPQRGTRLALSSKAVAEAIKQDYIFRLSSSLASRKASLAMSSRIDMSTSYFLPSTLIIGDDGSQLFSLLLQQATDDKTQKSILRALCLDDDQRCSGVVQLTLSGDSQIRLTSGLTIGVKDTPTGVYLRAKSSSQTADILVSWADQDANRKNQLLDRLINAKSIAFEVKSTRSITEHDGEAE